MTDIPRETLYHYYVHCGLTPREIAPLVNLSKWAVVAQLRKHYIPMRKRGSRGYKTLAQMTAARNEMKEQHETASV